MPVSVNDPIGHCLAGDGDPQTGKLLLLAVQGKCQSIFAVQDMGQQAGRGQAAAGDYGHRDAAFLHGYALACLFALTAAIHGLDVLTHLVLRRDIYQLPAQDLLPAGVQQPAAFRADSFLLR